MIRSLARLPSSEWFRVLLLASAILIIPLNELILAQSGRRPKPAVPTPPSQTTEPGDSQKVAPAGIQYLIIGGHSIDKDTKEVFSNYVSSVVEACSEKLKERPTFQLQIKNGGKMTKTEAVERAKRETDAYVLWFGYRSDLIDLRLQVVYMDYVVLTPQSATTLTDGRVDLRTSKKAADPGGVIRLPSGQTRHRTDAQLLREGGREIAERVRNKL